MPNPKLLVLGKEEDFTQDEVKWLSDMIYDKLQDLDFKASSYSFQVRVEWLPTEAKNDRA
tara:strand:- start:1403 stop:1582 length:180 start_codon:yes stop_codon:yes gene_type:complete